MRLQQDLAVSICRRKLRWLHWRRQPDRMRCQQAQRAGTLFLQLQQQPITPSCPASCCHIWSPPAADTVACSHLLPCQQAQHTSGCLQAEHPGWARQMHC